MGGKYKYKYRPGRKLSGWPSREARNEYMRLFRKKNPGDSRCDRDLMGKKNKERSGALGRPRPDNCEVCKKSAQFVKYRHGLRSTIMFDHCHETGKARGWLCQNCNFILGLAGDNPEVLDSLAAYLRTFQGVTVA